MLVKYFSQVFYDRMFAKRRRSAKLVPDYRKLESRQLLAVTLVLNGTELTIQGTGADDSVQVFQSSNDITVQVTGGVTGNYFADQLTLLRFNGGAGNDTFINYSFIDSRAEGHVGNDVLQGGLGNDFLRGGPGQDVLNGAAGADQIFGHLGADTIYGGLGDDFIRGGAGNDIIYGGDGNDTINGDWGNDEVFGELGNDDIRGAVGDDILHGGDGDDVVNGQAGLDYVYGDDGRDRLRGGNGNDYLYGGAGDDFALADLGDDFVWGGDGSDVLHGFLGDDQIVGGAGDDFIYGSDGADALYGGEGRDIIRGGDGDDVIKAEDGNDFVKGDAGNDQLRGGTGNDRLLGDAGDDQIDGQSGDDALFGGAGNDFILGADGVDELHGNSGNDVLFAGLNVGADSVLGGGGLDRFLVRESFQVGDQDEFDARLVFQDETSMWTDREVMVVNAAFDQLFAMTDNNRLLQDSVPSGDLTFYKYADLNGSSGINYLQWSSSFEWNGREWIETIEYSREIHISDWDETSTFYNDFYQSTIIHELAHNWDDQIELDAVSADLGLLWGEFLGIGGWTQSNPGSNTHTQSGDGQWWYSNTASFAEPYGRTNPNEDMATLWVHYFNEGLTGDANLLLKLSIVDQVMEALSA